MFRRRDVTCLCTFLPFIAAMLWAMPVAAQQALSLDGSNDFVSVADGAGVDLSTNFTIEAWVYLTADQHATIAGKDGSTRPDGSYLFRVLQGGRLGYETRSGGSLGADGVVALNTWTHVAVIRDESLTGSSENTRLFVNGKQVAAGNITAPTPNDNPLWIGAMGSGQHFPGRIDELRIWKEARTLAELRSNMHTTFGHDPDGVLTEFRFEGNLADTYGNVTGVASGGATLTASTAPLFSRTEATPLTSLKTQNSGAGYVSLPAAAVNNLSEGTIEFWMMPDAVGGNVLVKQHDGVNTMVVVEFSGSNVSFRPRNGAPSVATTSGVDLNRWQHVAITFDTQGGQIYLNGRLEQSVSGNMSVPDDLSPSWFRLGYNFNGQIDEFRVWDHKVPADSLRERRHGSVDPALHSESLLTYYRFDENNFGARTAIYDLAGGHHGDLRNGAWWVPSNEGLFKTTDVALAITADKSVVEAGGRARFTVTVRNESGTATQTMSVALSKIGTSVLESATTAAGTFDANTGIWTIGALAANSAASLTLDITPQGVAGYTGEVRRVFPLDSDALAGDGLGDDYSGLAVVPAAAGDANHALQPDRNGNGFARFPDANALDLTSTFTLAAWVNPTNVSGHHTIISKDGTSATPGSYVLRIFPGGSVNFERRGGGSLGTAAGLVPVNRWSHVAAVFDAQASPNLKLYVNGALAAAGNVAATTANGNALLIGSFNESTQVFNGLIDEVEIWNVARSGAELRNGLSATRTGGESGLVAYYRFDENNAGSLPDAFDSAGNDNGGALFNGASWAPSTAPVTGRPNIVLSMTSNRTVVSSGDPVTITMRVENTGAAPATRVMVRVLEQLGFSGLSATPPSGSSFSGGIWTIPLIQAGGSWSMDVQVSGSGTGLRVFSSEVTAQHQRDVNGVPGDGLGDDYTAVGFVPSGAGGGQALSLDGSGAHVFVPSPPQLGSKFTIEAWVNVDANRNMNLVSRQGSYDVNLLSGGKIEFQSGNHFYTTRSGAFAYGIWQHIAVVFDASSAYPLTVLVNGAKVEFNDDARLAPASSAEALFIGKRSRGDLSFDGQIEELRYWATPRSQAQIRAAMFAPLVGNENGLILYHRYDLVRNLRVNADGTDDVQDHSGSLSHGDLAGTAAVAASSAPIELGGEVSATDDVYEDRVEIQWSSDQTITPVVQVTRDGKLLGTLSNLEESFKDLSGEPNKSYAYCVVADAADGTRTVLGCDAGRRRLAAAADVRASDLLYNDRIVVTWTDKSAVETGYAVFRDETLLATLQAGAKTYTDTTPAAGTTYTYCVAPVQNGIEGTARVCDTGSVGETLPVLAVIASDGTYPDFVRIIWQDQGQNTSAFEVRRDGTLIHTASAGVLTYDDRSATSGTVHTYCVRRLQGEATATDVCNEGSIGTLTAPGNVAASDDASDERIDVSWTDRSKHENGFRVYRTGGAALTFDGTSDYVSVPQNIDLTDAFTVEAWVYITGNQHSTIVSRDGTSATDGAFMFRVLENGRLSYETRNGGFVGADAVVPQQKWTHVAVVHDATLQNGNTRLYVNGLNVAAGNVASPKANGRPMWIGILRPGQQLFKGSMDELRLWKEARTEVEIRNSLYTALTASEEGLYAYYPFDEGSGTLVGDVFGINSGVFPSSTADHPTWAISGAPLVQHASGSSLQLDGTDDYGIVDDHDAVDVGDAFTIEAWVYPTADQHAAIVSKDGASATSGSYVFRILQGRKLNFETRNGGSVTSEGIIQPNQWTHVAVTHGPASEGANTRLYVNGREVASGTVARPTANAHPMWIGRLNELGQYLAGRIDNLRIWNVARSGETIRSQRFSSLTGAEPNLAFHLPFDGKVDVGAGAAGFNDVRASGSHHADLRGGPEIVRGVPLLVSQTGAGSTTFSDVNAKPLVLYQYCLAAFTDQGVETAWACDTGRRSAAVQPNAISATDGTYEDRVEVSWTNTSSQASAFKVYRGTTLLATLPATTLKHTDKDIASDTNYSYCVTAVSSDGAESPSSCDSGRRSLKAPKQVKASDDEHENKVRITWVDNSSVEKGYRIYRREVTNAAAGTLSADSLLVDETFPSFTEAIDSTGVPGKTYRYTAQAFDALGVSAQGFDLGSRRLNAPTRVAAEDGKRETEIRITWEDASLAERGFRIYRNNTLVGTVGRNTQEFTDTAPSAGSVTYGVEAFDHKGASTRNEDTGYTILLPPGEVAASKSYTDRVMLTWSDRSSIETGYVLYRNGSAFDWAWADDVALIDANTNPTPGTPYEYCVATWRDGNGDNNPFLGGGGLGSTIDPEDAVSQTVCDSGLRLPAAAAPSAFTSLTNQLGAEDGASGDEFGVNVATAGGQMMVGAWYDNNRQGAVYIYERTENGWVQTQKLTASDGQQDDYFGTDVDMTESYAIVGAHNKRSGLGSVYFYERRPEGWVETMILDREGLCSNANFGLSVATDGNWAIIGAPLDSRDNCSISQVGSVYVYGRDGETWSEIANHAGVGRLDRLGWSVDIFDDLAAVGAPEHSDGPGYVSVFKRTGTQWSVIDRFNPRVAAGNAVDTRFGESVTIWGDFILVGSPLEDELAGNNSGSVYSFKHDGSGSFDETHRFGPSDHRSSHAVGKSIAVFGDQAIVGANETAYVFRRQSNDTWSQERAFKNGLANGSAGFGRSVFISPERNILVGDPTYGGAGTVFLLETTPAEPTKVAATDGAFENRVEITWKDNSDNEDGFRVFRDGELIHTTPTDETAYIDEDAEPGVVNRYCIQAVRSVYNDVSEQACDLGWRFPDGAVAGKVITTGNAGSENIEICLNPAPNGALVLDGHEGVATTTDSFQMPDNFTIEFWARITGSANDKFLIGHGESVRNRGLLIGFLANGKVRFDFFENALEAAAPTDRGWHHYAFTFDDASNARRIFIDGSQAASDVSAEDYTGNGKLVVGRHLTGGANYEGLVDEIRIWDRATAAALLQERSRMTIRSNEPGLVAHWSLDERKGAYSANDVAKGTLYLHHSGGIAPIRPGASIQTCTLTGAEGDYRISGIRYGESTEFSVLPADPDPTIRRQFSPPNKVITLSRENPVQNELQFLDKTRYAVAGRIQFDGTECAADGVSIRANGVQAAVTDAEGFYNFSVDPGQLVISPGVPSSARTFASVASGDSQISLNLEEDVFGKDFVDKTRHRFHGFVAGGSGESCRKPIGRAKIRIKAQNSCMEQEIWTDDQGGFHVNLPPQKYFAQVIDVENSDPTRKVDILKFFEEQGAVAVNLAEAAEVEHDFKYIGPLKVTVVGLAPSSCAVGDVTDNAPILTSGAKDLILNIKVEEDYGSGQTCAADTAAVVIYNEIADLAARQDTLFIGKDDRGIAVDTFTVGAPNVIPGRTVTGVDRSYQKFYTAVANVHGRTETATEWAYVTGEKNRPGGQFATVPNTPVPVWVLHDPPGDASYSYLEKGSTICNSFDFNAGVNVAISLGAEITANTDGQLGFSGWGAQTTIEVEYLTTAGLTLSLASEAAAGGGFSLCATNSESLQTSEGEDFVGPDADLFVGLGTNFIFGVADKLQIDVDGDQCSLTVDDVTTLGAEVESAFAYSRHHIENDVIPRLEKLASEHPGSAGRYDLGVKNYRSMLESSEATRNRKREDRESFIEDELGIGGDRKNLSYDAGALYQFSKTNEKSERATTDLRLALGVEAALSVGMEPGVIVSADMVTEAWFEFNFAHESTTGTTRGFVLSDDDQGDSYTVDVFNDPAYGVPVFDVLAGHSSCPYEPWISPPLLADGSIDAGAPKDLWSVRPSPRDAPNLRLNPPSLSNLNPLEPGLFKLFIENQSATSEARKYRLELDAASNPDGAKLEAGGLALGAGGRGLLFEIGPQQTQTLELAVRRGPSRYVYEDLKLTATPECGDGGGVSASTLLDVSFKPPCSAISIFQPKNPWKITRATVDSPLEVILEAFTLEANDIDAGIKKIGLEYRRIGTPDWLPAFEVDRAAIVAQGGNAATAFAKSDWVFPDEDGAYELRAYTVCDVGKNFSDTVQGMVDSELPQVIGTPEPADRFLALGDEITLTFNEPVSCKSVVTGGQSPNVTLKRADTEVAIPIEATCDGRDLVIEPQSSSVLNGLEGVELKARVAGVTDLAGNPIGDAVEWQFTVRRNAFGFSPAALSLSVPMFEEAVFEATLANGRSTEVSFTLMDVPEWLTPSLTKAKLPPGGVVTIQFTVAATGETAQRTATLRAHPVTGDDSTLEIELSVLCSPADWVVNPSEFPFNMSVTGQLFFDGIASNDGDDRVAAYVGDQIRGIAPVTPGQSGNRVHLTVYGRQDAGEVVTFRAYDASECRVYTETSKSITFTDGGVFGTPAQPISIQAGAAETQGIALYSGWTWLSINKQPDDASIGAVFADVTAAKNDLVKSQTQFSLYDSGLGWIGTLQQFDPIKAYLVRLTESHEIVLTGSPIDVGATELEVRKGWNWIGYLPGEPMPVGQALTNLTPTTGDLIKSQVAFAQYVEGVGWIGSLQQMEPGKGYLLRLANPGRFVYPEAAAVAAVVMDKKEAPPAEEAVQFAVATESRSEEPTSPRMLSVRVTDGPDWSVDASSFEHSMSVVAEVELDGDALRSTQSLVAAFVGEECRGVTQLQYVSSLDRHLAFMTVFSSVAEGEEVTFHVYDAAADTVYAGTGEVAFEPNAVVGTLTAPYVLQIQRVSTSAESAVELPDAFSLEQNYPNPFNPVTTIRFDLPEPVDVELAIYDLLGREVRLLVNDRMAPGRHEVAFDAGSLASGMYVYQIRAGAFVQTRRMILMK